jgi:ADP-heptose:LPS heptosyltransferase
MPLALVAVAGGIGDIVRATPLVRVCHALGYAVDVRISADYPEVGELLLGAPEIRRLYVLPSAWCRQQHLGHAAPESSPQPTYDVAVFTTLASPLRAHVRSRRAIVWDMAQWRRDGDPACVDSSARALGWKGPLPSPFVRASDRRFDLAPETIALHAGCKPGWSWKRWPGFLALAERLEHVVAIGGSDDPPWPSHVDSWVGRLSLADTAALLRQCAALVSNDSGLLHVAAALGIPTLGVFGITSPARELMPMHNIAAVTKQLPCETACRARPWGRRDCEYHIECLRTLRADEVLVALHAHRARVATSGAVA